MLCIAVEIYLIRIYIHTTGFGFFFVNLFLSGGVINVKKRNYRRGRCCKCSRTVFFVAICMILDGVLSCKLKMQTPVIGGL